MAAGPPPPASELQGLGVVKRLLGALGSQGDALELIEGAHRSIRILAFSWDRQDLTEALVRARERNVLVRVGADRKQTLGGKTRDQTARLLELAAAGAE
eukprot:3446009-Alexandrium_andersonii.AAC.1